MLLKRFADYLRTGADRTSFRVAISSDGDDERSLPAAEPIVTREAEVVEGARLEVHPVGPSEGTGFTHFLDGIQETRRIGFYQYTVPILYGFVAAAVRRRNSERHMSTHDKVAHENLYFSFAHLDPGSLRSAGIEARDAGEEKEPSDDGDVHPLRLLELARRAVSNDRAELERRLAGDWADSSAASEWLFWDGSITGALEASKHPRVIGVVKSHQTQYFGVEDQRKILSLTVGERSSVFQPKGRDWAPIYSWYLRLRSNEGRDVYFGLVRVEAAVRPETIAMADEISRWLMAERAPLSLPDARWDRMMYPIRDCEQYLRSIAPSKVAIDAALGGL